MPAVTVPKGALALGAGFLYYAPLGTSLPANDVAGSVFTDVWPVGWTLLGITKSGHEFSYDLKVGEIDSAEYLDVVAYVTEGRSSGMTFELQQIHATNFKRALNGGTLTVTGSGATQLNTYTPPQPGAEVRCMIGWESTDNTERLAAEQAFQQGSVKVKRNKGSNNATLPLDWKFEVAASGLSFNYWTAGALRG